MYDWTDNPEVTPVRIQSMAEVCGRESVDKRADESQLDMVLRFVKKGKRVFYDAPDGTTWRIKAKRVKE